MLRRLVVVGLVALGVACKGARGPEQTGMNPMPKRSKPPACVTGELVTSDRICGLGVAGPAMVWNDPAMLELAQRRAARNLAGVMRSMVTSAMIQVDRNSQTPFSKSSIRWEADLEVNEATVDQIVEAAHHSVWFDVQGEGPFRVKHRTYHCACMSTKEAGIPVDMSNGAQHAMSHQYNVDEVPEWLDLDNPSLHCAVGWQGRMIAPENMYEPLTDNVRVQLTENTKAWVLQRYNEETVCSGRSGDCQQIIHSVVEAANEGVSRGVVLTAMWLDANGIGPVGQPHTAYGWGCIYDQAIINRINKRLASFR